MESYCKMNIFGLGSQQHLQDILYQRQWRAEHIEQLLQEYGKTVLCFKLNIPGPIKNNSYIRTIFEEGKLAIQSRLALNQVELLYDEVVQSDAGDEYYAVCLEEAQRIKTLACEVEENHFWGRLFDMDVSDRQGSVSRTDLGYPQRRCLLCSKRAVECARSRAHTVEELQKEISSLYELFQKMKMEKNSLNEDW